MTNESGENSAWNVTDFVEKNADPLGVYEERDIQGAETRHKYEGRDLISRDTRINGGVYFSGANEAIVVGGTEDQHILDEVYSELVLRLDHGGDNRKSSSDGYLAVVQVYQLVREKLPYSRKKVDEISEKYNLKDGSKVSLGVYINEGAGVCRHETVLDGYLMERLIDDKIIDGSVSVDRNSIPGKGGHSWARYVDADGQVYILDNAMQYVGTIEGAQNRGKWNYERPQSQSGFWKRFTGGK